MPGITEADLEVCEECFMVQLAVDTVTSPIGGRCLCRPCYDKEMAAIDEAAIAAMHRPTRTRGAKPKPHPRKHVMSQRYTDHEQELIERAAGGKRAAGAFIHTVAVAAAAERQTGGE